MKSKIKYDTSDRTLLSPEAVGLSGESANAVKRIELLSEDPEQFLRVVFAQPKSLTAKVRNDLVRVLGKSNLDHLLILASDFDALEFVFLDKRKRAQKGPGGTERIQVVPKTISVNRRTPTRQDLRTLRRFTWTCRDALEQFDKLRSVFDAAAYTGEYFQNRGLFSDYFLRDRLREDPTWRDNPSEMFAFVRDLFKAHGLPSVGLSGKDKDALRNQLLEPLFKKLGFKPTVNRPSKTDQTQPDYLLYVGGTGVSPVQSQTGGAPVPPKPLTAAFVYAWDRWLDGPDLNDTDTPDENPGACVVTALDQGIADWIIVTNGRLWRLYSRQAHARATNFYEVDLVEALTASGDTDPNEAFRYWWLFLRPQAFLPSRTGVPPVQTGEDAGPTKQSCWLDDILLGSREYAKRLGDRLKDRIFLTIFPHLAQGFLEDRKHRLGRSQSPTEEELADIFEATLTLLYRLLFLLYAESRDLLPIREAPYQASSLKKVKDELADKAGVAESEVAERLNQAYSAKDTTLYDRLCKLFQAMDKGDPILNVPTYNGGLFSEGGSGVSPDRTGGTPVPPPENREQRIARFLREHKVPDRHLALAIDRLARDQDERTLALVFIDYKSLEVRHLGSIYEGLLEFKLKVADEDLATQADKKGEKYIPLSKAPASRKRQRPEAVVRKGEVYLSNDKAERKSSGSYYTPDPIVEYIVAHTVGPVLEEKLEALRPEFRKVRKTFDRHLKNAEVHLPKPPDGRPGASARPWASEREYALTQTFLEHKDLVEQLFDLRVLDPAMGSGHFLVEVVDFVTDKLLNFLNQFPINPVNFALDRTRQSILESLGEQGVSVDPNKLTDINLLKRHVLKRCIYGVDLNPMAVELAKVSLWLDAFTLGAPLNFLDHHLRCGNSLIGATFDELEKATVGPLYTIDYGPLLRAIQHVLFVSKMADATATEVARSVNEYGQARQELSGFQIALDLVAAQYFGYPKAPSLLAAQHSVKLGNREVLLASLRDNQERTLVAEVEALAQRPDRRFFHWEIEFPEVFFGFLDADERQIMHKDKIEAGSAGFDCVVGNPPYVRMELIKPVKPFLKESYQCHSDRADIFIYFHEKAVFLLRDQGYYSYICSSNWIKTAAGGNLRHLLTSQTTLTSAVDLSEANVFEDASTYPCIFVARNAKPLSDSTLSASIVEDRPSSAADLEKESFPIRLDSLGSGPWLFSKSSTSQLLDRLLTTGRCLKDVYGSPLYGIKTGLNEAFVVETSVRDSLIRADPKCAVLLKPFLEGKDVHQWKITPRNLWLIYSTKGTDIEEYPSLFEHLSQYREDLEKRAAKQEWFELQQAQLNYSDAYGRPKIVFPRFVNQPCFASDSKGYYINNAISAIPAFDPVLLFLLMSPVSWFVLRALGAPMANGYRQLHGHVVERLPIPNFSDAAKSRIKGWVECVIGGGSVQEPPWSLVYEALDISPEQQRIILENQA